MKKNLLLLLIFSTSNMFACLNGYYTLNEKGEIKKLEKRLQKGFQKSFDLQQEVNNLINIEKKLKEEKDYMLLSDYTIGLMKIGKQKEALEILVELYKHYPNEYIIAANLGTAYELNGQVDSALKYIQLDMILNPNDHEGSEWIHVKVLETKLALQKDASYLSNHTVLNLSEEQKKDEMVLKHLRIQLEERVPFSPGPDAIMASLFTDLGDVSAKINSVEYAKAYYHIAKNYYGGDAVLLNTKIKAAQQHINRYVDKNRGHGDSIVETIDIRGPEPNYKTLLIDNNPKDYKIDLTKINTNVKALLAMVELQQEAAFVGFDKIAPVNDDKEGVGPGMSILLILVGVGVIALIWYFIKRGQEE